MPQLIQIGNSRGIRIPEALIQQAGLEDMELEFALVKDGLLIKPVRYRVHQGWEKQVQEAIQVYGSEEMDSDWLDAPLTDDDEREKF
jgi:antitoxin MazE